MRSQSILRRRLLFKTASPGHRPFPYQRALSRREPPSRIFSRRPLSSAPSAVTPPTPDPPTSPEDDGQAPPIEGEAAPLKARSKPSVSSSKETESVQLPESLDILWPPEDSIPDPYALPPPEILEECLNHLLVALHPQTQHKATYPPPLGQAVEPNLAFYCPIEGGDYVVDATVRELASRIGAEVLVLDSVQLAAGEWGEFGKAANSLQLPRNPLHFQAGSVQEMTSTSNEDVEDEDAGSPIGAMIPQQMTLTLMSPLNMSPGMGQAVVYPGSRKPSPPSKIKQFFDAVVNLPPKEGPTAGAKYRPRLVYIRDYPTLAPTSSVWYPHLLDSVRQRRRNSHARSSSAIGNPVAMVFGISPPIIPSSQSSGAPSPGFLNLLMNRSVSQVVAAPRVGKVDWSESENAEKARERRLRERLKKWERGDASIFDDIPALPQSEEETASDSHTRPDVVILPFPGSGQRGMGLLSAPRNSSPETNVTFFRTSILVPSSRSVSSERDCRVSRRREINELTIRMAVGAIGGMVENERADVALAVSPPPSSEASTTQEMDAEPHTESKESTSPQESHSALQGSSMWEDWGRRIEVWPNVRQIADHTVGSVVANKIATGETSARPSLEPTLVPWSAVQERWTVHQSRYTIRKKWLNDVLPTGSKIVEEAEEVDEGDRTYEELIERLKADNDLDQHEQRLLHCIVDSSAMPTSFSQVHLPPATIDSVRTIVSLPLLYPKAFEQGVLREHAMTGCLLFGPPGTGKTLVVKALAKEAGCNMMAISPADVMDMYVGEGEKLVKAVFSLARRISPCVVFLDEIDALFGARMSARDSGGAFAHRGVITEFMQEMDGLKSSKDDRVIVIGATNRPFDLDEAVLRRLPRRLLVDLPGPAEREEILKILLRGETLSPEVDLSRLALQTDGFSGSDLKHLCVAAALDAVKGQVSLPWQQTEFEPSSETDSPRTLKSVNFVKALKEIPPSTSEVLGSLTELRKWNDEFGEGGKAKRRQVWGKDRFGFGNKDKSVGVADPMPLSLASTL